MTSVWYFFVDIHYEKKITWTVTNHGFWDKNNIEFKLGNKSQQEVIMPQNSSFLFIEAVGCKTDSVCKGFDLIPCGGCWDTFRYYETNNQTITAYGWYFPSHDLNYSSVNNSLKVVFGEKFRESGLWSGVDGKLSGYYELPTTFSCSWSHKGLYIKIIVEKNYTVFVNDKLLGVNDTAQFVVLSQYRVSYTSLWAELLWTTLLAIPCIVVALIVSNILKKFKV